MYTTHTGSEKRLSSSLRLGPEGKHGFSSVDAPLLGGGFKQR